MPKCKSVDFYSIFNRIAVLGAGIDGLQFNLAGRTSYT
ncbi:hypothetical protein AEST_16750 [Alishewanella aestuarii B11]|uniref:Uncharacterized protein n=1 Tax=Alishewanella aestuarii B11 TaxID=1197174 RepID=J1QIJ2_9ALTE|nr:hypothetical protein AEST_16750 [Alishewanella aestuarii B11]